MTPAKTKARTKTKPNPKRHHLSSTQMATFAAQGYLRFDACVPDAINQAFLERVRANTQAQENPLEHYARLMTEAAVPFVDPGTPWTRAYKAKTPIGDLLRLPQVRGAIDSLVGRGAVVDHHFLHITFPPAYTGGKARQAQHTHQDSTIDPRQAFDLQIMYFPHEVTAEMGGTRFVPGTHLRIVSEAAISRYQNIVGQQHMVCPAGTLLFLHHGIWHGGGSNRGDIERYMLKIRLCPQVRQRRLWNCTDLSKDHKQQRPIFWSDPSREADPVQQILMQPQPWFEADTGRLELVNRIRFWRYLLGDDSYDADYWLTRLENEPAR